MSLTPEDPSRHQPRTRPSLQLNLPDEVFKTYYRLLPPLKYGAEKIEPGIKEFQVRNIYELSREAILLHGNDGLSVTTRINGDPWSKAVSLNCRNNPARCLQMSPNSFLTSDATGDVSVKRIHNLQLFDDEVVLKADPYHAVEVLDRNTFVVAKNRTPAVFYLSEQGWREVEIKPQSEKISGIVKLNGSSFITFTEDGQVSFHHMDRSFQTETLTIETQLDGLASISRCNSYKFILTTYDHLYYELLLKPFGGYEINPCSHFRSLPKLVKSNQNGVCLFSDKGRFISFLVNSDEGNFYSINHCSDKDIVSACIISPHLITFGLSDGTICFFEKTKKNSWEIRETKALKNPITAISNLAENDFAIGIASGEIYLLRSRAA